MVTILTTGGTFDKVYFDANSAFSIGDPQAALLLEEANVAIDYQIKSVLKKDSLDIDEQDRQQIIDAVQADNNQRIVITHGTDGMAATAKTLAASNMADKVIVLVGAMQPARMRVSDAPFNLGFALACVQLLSPGIYIAMNGRVFDHDNVKKNLAAGRFETLS